MVGHVLNDLCASMWFTYLLLFFQKVLYFNRTNSGLILLIGQLADGISTTVVGLLSDKTKNLLFCRKYGTQKSWHLLGTICVLGSFPFIFLPCLGCESWPQEDQLIYYAVFVCIFQFGWASTQISHLALIPSLSSCHEKRTSLTALRYGATVASNITVYLITWIFFGVDGNSDEIDNDDTDKFRNIMLVTLGIGSFTSICFHLLTKEPTNDKSSTTNDIDITNHEEKWKDIDLSDEINEKEVQDKKAPVDTKKMGILNWLLEPQLYLVAGVYMCTRLFVNLSQSYIPLYLQDSLRLGPTFVAIIPLIMFCSGFVVSFVTRPINVRLGRKMTWMIGALIGAGAATWVYFDGGAFYNEYSIFFVAALYGAGSSVILITSLSLVADLIGANTESSAFVYGMMSFVDKVSGGLMVMLIQSLIPCLKLYETETMSTALPSSTTTAMPYLSTTSYCPVCPNPPIIVDKSACLSFYRIVLYYATGGACVAGAVFVAALIPFVVGRRWRDRNEENQDEEKKRIGCLVINKWNLKF